MGHIVDFLDAPQAPLRLIPSVQNLEPDQILEVQNNIEITNNSGQQ